MIQDVLLIDKPSGMTSHDVVDHIRCVAGEKRVGHAGTLDPLATGLLIILIGRNATKRQSEFLHLDKVYECTAQLGITTDTYDIEGQVATQAEWVQLQSIAKHAVEDVLQKFVGKIQQRVPAYSAVKVAGQKLYKKARRGKVKVKDLPIKTVEIFSLHLTDFQKNAQEEKIFFSFTVHCSSGTYIRSLVHDVGQQLKVGATVTQLRRVKIGAFDVKFAQKL